MKLNKFKGIEKLQLSRIHGGTKLHKTTMGDPENPQYTDVHIDRDDDDSSDATDNDIENTTSIDGNYDAPPQAESQCTNGLAGKSNMDWTTTDALGLLLQIADIPEDDVFDVVGSAIDMATVHLLITGWVAILVKFKSMFCRATGLVMMEPKGLSMSNIINTMEKVTTKRFVGKTAFAALKVVHKLKMGLPNS